MSDISTHAPTGSEPTLGTAVDPAVDVTDASSTVSKPGSAAHRIESELRAFHEISVLDAAQFECTPSNISQVISKMEAHGYKFSRRTEGRYTYYRLSEIPNPDDLAAAKERVKATKPARKATKRSAKRAVKAVKAAPEPQPIPLPTINENLRVCVIQSDAKGNVKLGLTDEKRTWLVSVTALASS